MNKGFNKKRMVDNIAFLLREQGRKPRDLEKETGVSPGYLVRLSSANEMEPSVDFLIKAAGALSVSMDTLLTVDLTELTETESYLLSFIEKLDEDTRSDKLDWIRESAEGLKRLEYHTGGSVKHPLFRYETFCERIICDCTEEISRNVFVSRSFDFHTTIADDCFHLRLKDGMVLYLMKISKTGCRAEDPDAQGLEMWMCMPHGGSQFLCSNTDNTIVSWVLDDLYRSVSVFAKHPKIRRDIRDAIDAYLQDGSVDDESNGEDAGQRNSDTSSIRRFSFG